MLRFTLGLNDDESPLPEAMQRALREQTIDEHQPGTLLRDFETLLQFVGDEGFETSGKHFLLPMNKLEGLNALTSRPAAHRLQRPQQRSFPHLHGLFLMLRSSGLGLALGAPPNGRLVLDQDVLRCWRDLNPTERYFALLESWLIFGSPEMIGERGGSRACFEWMNNLAWQLRSVATVVDPKQRRPLYDVMDLLTAALMELFGWLELEFAQPAAGEGVKVATIRRTAFGDAMVNLLSAAFMSHIWLSNAEDERVHRGALQPIFHPYFPEYQRALIQPEEPFREGTYTFRVQLGHAWRRIVVPAESTLESLALAILNSVDFDLDHLYCFNLRGRSGRSLRIACPYEAEADYNTDEFTVGDLPLPEGGTMTMLFDYGDCWEFSIKLEQIGPPNTRQKRPKVTAKGGKPPRQYDSDDW